MINDLKDNPDFINIIFEISRVVSSIEKNEDKISIAIDNLLDYGYLLYSWGRVHNIISRKQKLIDILENIYDSIVKLKHLKEILTASKFVDKYISDAGAGGGLPGIPLAIVFPEKKFLLIDSDRKKCSFLRSIKAKMNLHNISVANKKIESLEQSAVIITKAAFPPIHSGILANATSHGGNLAIWATPKTSQEFVDELMKFGVYLDKKLDYNLPSGKERSLLLFVKA